MVMSVSRRCCSILLQLFLSLLLVGLLYTPIYADGGAPQLAYVAGAAQGIGVIDIAQRRVTGVIAAVKNPRTILLSQDGQMLYVTQPLLGRVTVLFAKTGKTLCTVNLPGQPSLLALSLNATVLYAAGQGDSSVRAINPTTCAIQRTFETHVAIYGLAVAASTAPDATPSTPNQLWVTGTASLTIFIINGSLLGSVPIAGGPQVDVLTPVVANTPAVAPEPTRVLRLSHAPQSVAITSDGQLGFVALSNGQVLMLDIPGRSIVSSIEVGGAPRFIITGLYPPTNNAPATSRPATRSSTSPGSLLRFIGLALLAGIFLLGMLWLLWRGYRKKFHDPHSTHKSV